MKQLTSPGVVQVTANPIGRRGLPGATGRPVCIHQIWRDCTTGDAYYVFHDGSTYHYPGPAIPDAIHTLLADNHGVFFNRGIRRNVGYNDAYSKVTSIPGTATKIYEDPPYRGTDPGPCRSFPQPITYFNCETLTPGLIDQVAGNNFLAPFNFGVTLGPGIIGNGLQRAPSPGVAAGGVGTSTFPQNLAPDSPFTLAMWWKFTTLAASDGTLSRPYADFEHPSFYVVSFMRNGSYQFQLEIDLANSNVTPSSVQSGLYTADTNWHFVAYIFDPAHTRFGFRLDGATTVFTPYTTGTPVNDPVGNDADTSLRSGNPVYGESSSYSDEIGLWDIALDDTQLDYLWNGGVGRTYPF